MPKPPVRPSDETRLERLAREVMACLERLDEDTRALGNATGLGCPPGCGACCENPHIETTVLELLPAAFELLERGEAEHVLERPEVQGGEGRCTFFEPSSSAGGGRCGLYAHRPGICRLFGFASVHTRRGSELAACRVHRLTAPHVVSAAERHVAEGGRAGNFASWGVEVAGLEPTLGTHPLPFNEALRQALVRVLSEADWRARQSNVVNLFPPDPDPEDEPPLPIPA